MAAALALGRRGLGRTWPNPSVGCLIVRDGAIVGRGATAPGGRPHGEPQALAEAGESARGATAYVTLEPCSHFGRTPPCADALIAAGLARVVVAIPDPDPRVAGQGIARLRAAGIAVDVGIGAEEARRDHAGHIARVALGRPHVTLKLAVSADDAIALRGERTAITGPEAQTAVHLLRATHDAVLVGARTVAIDDPLLTVRLPGAERFSPVRIVLDTALSLSPASRLVATAAEVPVHVLGGYGADPAKARALEAGGVTIHRISTPFLGGGGLNLVVALRELVKLGLTRVLIEAGQRLATALIERDLVDEVVVHRSPDRLGARGIAAIAGGRVDDVIAPPRFIPLGTRPLGRDVEHRHWRDR